MDLPELLNLWRYIRSDKLFNPFRSDEVRLFVELTRFSKLMVEALMEVIVIFF
jgi:hypothetical protein